MLAHPCVDLWCSLFQLTVVRLLTWAIALDGDDFDGMFFSTASQSCSATLESNDEHGARAVSLASTWLFIVLGICE